MKYTTDFWKWRNRILVKYPVHDMDRAAALFNFEMLKQKRPYVDNSVDRMINTY